MVNKKINIGVIGGGNMGSAIINGIYKQHRVRVCESDRQRAGMLKRKFKVAVAEVPAVMDSSKVILLAVKPQSFEAVLKDIKPYIKKSHVVVSIAAGITTRYIERRLVPGTKVVRTMPNLPAQVNEGVTGIASGQHATASDTKLVKGLFRSIGTTVIVPEKHIDAITAVSGSGPAYVFLFAECFSKAAKSLGLSKELSDDIVLQTLKGSLALLEQQDEDAAVLRKRVTSKGGTTQAALEVFSRSKIEKTFNQALKAARKRAKELSR